MSKALSIVTQIEFDPMGTDLSFTTEEGYTYTIHCKTLRDNVTYRPIFKTGSYFNCIGSYSMDDDTSGPIRIYLIHETDGFELYGFNVGEYVRIVSADMETRQVNIETLLNFGLSISEDIMQRCRWSLQDLYYQEV